MAAEVEEAVVDGDRAGQAQHLGEQAAEQFLLRCRGCPSGGRGGEVGGGEGPPVDLAARGERERVERDDGGREHVGGQRLGGEGAQFGLVERPVRYDVGDEPGAGGAVVVDRHGRGEDPGVAREDVLDLAGFDAEAADLDLVVGAAEVFESSVAGAADQVAGAVHPLPRRERVGDEPFGGERRAAEVAAGRRRTGTARRGRRAGRGSGARRARGRGCRGRCGRGRGVRWR